MIEREANSGQHKNVRNRDTREYGDPADGERHRQAEVVQLVEPLLNPPDVRICWQVHAMRSFYRGRTAPLRWSVDSERVSDSRRQCLHDPRRIEHHRDGHGEHDELHEAGDLAGEEKEERDDPHDAKEQRPEKSLKVGDQTLGTERDRRRGKEMGFHNSSLPGSTISCLAASGRCTPLTLRHISKAWAAGWPSPIWNVG